MAAPVPEPTREGWVGGVYGKHMPFYGKGWAWTDVVQRTGGTKPVARYIDTLTPNDIHDLEFQCVNPDPFNHRNEILPPPKPHMRVFWMDAGHVIGASKGEETQFIRVEVTSGQYHGRPVTWQELVEDGVQ